MWEVALADLVEDMTLEQGSSEWVALPGMLRTKEGLVIRRGLSLERIKGCCEELCARGMAGKRTWELLVASDVIRSDAPARTINMTEQ
jgi:hypothetical protein